MRKELILICLLQASLSAHAQSLDLRLLAQNTPQPIDTEAAPAPEAPYPGGDEGAIKKPYVSRVRPSVVRPPESQPEAVEEKPIEKPRSVNEDGDYVYDTKETTPTPSGRADIEAPISTESHGAFRYKKSDQPVPFSGNPAIEAPVTTNSQGEFRYVTPEHKSSKSASFRVGIMTPPSIRNPDNDKTFSDVYGNSPLPVLSGDYELYRPHWWPIGRISILVGTGLTTSSGQGYFVDRNRTDIPDQKFQFFMFPNTATVNYKFQFSDYQIFVPYVEAGVGYFTFVEIRDDAKNTKFGGAPVALVSGGLNFLFDSLDRHAIRELDAEYGINHLWMTLQARQMLGLESSVNFTSTAFNLGFIVEF